MRRHQMLALILLACAPLVAADSFLLRFGVGQTQGRDWSGSVDVRGGRLTGLTGWQFDRGDQIAPESGRWQVATRQDEYWHSPWERSLFGTKRQTKLSERGVVVEVEMDGPGTVAVQTVQGSFEFSPGSLEWESPQTFLGGAVEVSRAPTSRRIESEGSEDYPAVLLAGDGTEWIAWQTYADTGDRLWVRRGDAEPEPLTPAGADLFRIRLAEGRDGAVWAVWSEQKDGNVDLYARTFAEGSWGRTERLTRAPGSDIFHHLAADSAGRLYLVWQNMDGPSADVYFQHHDGSAWGERIRVTDSPANDWEPSVAVSRTGKVVVAWDTYRNGNYDIYLRYFEDGSFGEPVTVAATPCFEARPRPAFDRSGRLWLAWEEGDPQWGKDYVNEIRDAGMGLLMRRQVRVGVFDGTRLRQPKGDLAAVLPEEFRTAFVHPHLVIDSSGAPWIFFRYRTNTPVRRGDTFRSMWRFGASAYRNGHWTPLIRFPEGFGRIDAGTAISALPGGGLKAWWTSDGRLFPIGFPQEQDLYAATLPDTGGPAGRLLLEDFRFPADDFPAVHPNETAAVERLRTYRATVGNKTYRIVRGDMHRHTDISWDGNRDGSLIDSYRYALDAAAHDYLGVADHNAGEDIEYSWWMTQKAVDLLSIPGRFAPLYGYERSRSYPSGHRNVMFAQRGVPVLSHTEAERNDNANTSVDHLYRHLRANRGIVMSHTSATGAGTDWRDSDPEVETLMEIYQGYRNSYEHEGAPRSTDRGSRPAGFVWKAWEKGIKLGLQSSSDHVSTHASHGMIFVEDVTRESILDGIRARHAYAATDNILVDFRVNEALMGAAIKGRGQPKLVVRVVGTAPIDKVEVIRSNKYIHTQPGDGPELDFEFVDADAPAGESFYYIRVEQKNGELAWASPVWVTVD